MAAGPGAGAEAGGRSVFCAWPEGVEGGPAGGETMPAPTPAVGAVVASAAMGSDSDGRAVRVGGGSVANARLVGEAAVSKPAVALGTGVRGPAGRRVGEAAGRLRAASGGPSAPSRCAAWSCVVVDKTNAASSSARTIARACGCRAARAACSSLVIWATAAHAAA